MNEARLQIIQLNQKFQEDVSAQLLDTRQKINAARTKLLVADDQLNRLEIKAPRAGTVQGPRFSRWGKSFAPASR